MSKEQIKSLVIKPKKNIKVGEYVYDGYEVDVKFTDGKRAHFYAEAGSGKETTFATALQALNTHLKHYRGFKL